MRAALRARRSAVVARGSALVGVLLLALLGGCGTRRTPAPVTIRSLTGPPLLIEEPPPPLVERRVIARVRTAALATDFDSVYFGDLARDELYAAPKRGGDRVRIGDRAPLEIAVGERITWIGAPGNVVLETPEGVRDGGAGAVLAQTTGAFTDVASDSRDVLVTDALRSGGVLMRMSSGAQSAGAAGTDGRDGSATSRAAAARAVRLAALDVRPRELAIDAANAYVLSERAVHAVPRTGGAPRLLLEGVDLAGLEVAGGFLFTTGKIGSSRALLRFSTAGGAPVVLEGSVRESPVPAPFALFAEEVYFVDAEQPELRRVAVTGGPSGMVARAPEVARATELVVDGSGIYLATEDEIGPVVLGLPRPP